MIENGQTVLGTAGQHSGTILRTMSATFGGSTPLLAASEGTPSERIPLVGSRTRRELTQNQLQERIQEDAPNIVNSIMMRFLVYMLIIALVFAVAVITMVVFFFVALVAELTHFYEPCDQPLNIYLLVSTLGTQIANKLGKYFQRTYFESYFESSDGCGVVFATFAMSIPSWLILGWGLYMITHSKTCRETNPGLFYPTAHYMYCQCAFYVVLYLTTAVAFLLGRRILLILSTLSEQPGCKKAVYELPEVAADSKELVDPEDDQIMDCPICMDSLADGRTVRKAPCAHCYHEECLATWCQNHVDCPLCRQPIGPPDDPHSETQGAHSDEVV